MPGVDNVFGGPAEVLGLKLEDQSRKTRSVHKWEMHENVPTVELKYTKAVSKLS